GLSRRELHLVPAAQAVRRRREGGHAREVRVVGGDARPVARRAPRLRAAAQAARPLDRDTPEEHHGRRQVGVDDGGPVALPSPTLAGRNTGDGLYRAVPTGLALSLSMPPPALIFGLGMRRRL